MKKPICIVALFILAAPCLASPMEKMIFDELRDIHQQLNRVEKELTAVRKELVTVKKELKKEKSAAKKITTDHGGMITVDTEKLAAIELPAQPTREDYKKYVKEIKNACKGINSYSSSDPQVEMLADVGPDNLDILLDAATGDRMHGMSNFHLNYAIDQLVEEQHKELIIERLLSNKTLSRCVLKMGWEEDARAPLLTGLRNRTDNEYLPPEWIQSAANLEGSEHYQDLKDYLVFGSNRSHTYDAIKSLNIDGMTTAIDSAWEEIKTDPRSQYNIGSFAPIAANHGHQDAIDILIDELSSDQWRAQRARTAIRSCLDYKGSIKNLETWYGKHAEELQFDPKSKKFTLPKSD